jgi:hypothetical protein
MKPETHDIFDVDCMKCNRRAELIDMTINENSVVLCPVCISDHRIEKMLDISKKSFIVSFEKDWKRSWIYE